MFVRNHQIPITRVVSLQEDDTVEAALQVMEEHGHDALPVLNKRYNLVGVVSKQYIYKIFFQGNYDKEQFLRNTLVQQVMKIDYHYVRESDFIERAIAEMTAMRMQFVIVKNDRNELVGILTRKRLLEAMANALGMDKKGVRLEILVDDIQGRIAALSKVLAKEDYNIRSFFMFDPHLMNLQKIIIRLDTCEQDRVVRLLSESGFKVLSSVLE